MQSSEKLSKAKVLIVEDEGLPRRVWYEIFDRREWDVATANTIAEGLASLAPVPDYLILDLSLPDGDGETILRRVRDEHLKTRVTVMTGIEDPARLGRVRQLGPEALFLKPIDVDDICRESELAKSRVAAEGRGSSGPTRTEVDRPQRPMA